MKKPLFRRHSFDRVSFLSPNMRSAGIIVLAIVLLFGLVRLFAPGLFISMASPLWNLGSSLSHGIGHMTDSFGDTRRLTEDRDRLIDENAALTKELAAAKAELSDVGRVVGNGSGIVVGVMARPPITSYDVLVLAGGSNDGIAEGHVVYGNGGVPIGVIRDVTASTAKAALFSEAGRETHGWAGDERIPVVLVGTGSGTFRMTVSKDAGLSVGSEIYLPGPGAIPVGIISKIDSDPSSPEARVHIFPYANPFSLTYVRVSSLALP